MGLNWLINVILSLSVMFSYVLVTIVGKKFMAVEFVLLTHRIADNLCFIILTLYVSRVFLCFVESLSIVSLPDFSLSENVVMFVL